MMFFAKHNHPETAWWLVFSKNLHKAQGCRLFSMDEIYTYLMYNYLFIIIIIIIIIIFTNPSARAIWHKVNF